MDKKTFTISNHFLTVKACNFAGELKEIISNKTGKKYLWDGSNPAHWSYSAPFLFPIVGKVNNGVANIEGGSYEMGQHGFLRNSTLNVKSHESDEIVFELLSNSDTKKMYPYDFSVRLIYKLDNHNINSIVEIENTDNRDIYFSIGGHPALLCPFNKSDNFEDYYLEFEKEETLDAMNVTSAGLFSRNLTPYIKNEKTIDLSYKLFENDAIVFKNYKSEYVCLKSKKSENYIKMSIKDFPVIAFWTKKDAPFLCIEPWFGHADYEDFSGDFKEKAGIVKLEKGKTFTCNYNIEIIE